MATGIPAAVPQEAHPGDDRVESAPARRGCLLLVPRLQPSWFEFREQARVIQARTDFEPIMLLATPEMQGFAQRCRQEGIRYLRIDPLLPQDRGHFPGLEAAWQAAKRRLPALAALDPLLMHDRVAHCLPLSLWRSRQARRSLEAGCAIFHELLERHQPFAVLLQGDRELGPIPPLMKAARERGIPTVISATSGNYPTPMGSVWARRGKQRFYVDWWRLPLLLNRLAAARLPGQVMSGPQGRLLFSPGWLSLLLDGQGMLSPNPWIQGGGLSDHMLVDSRYELKAYARHGVARDKMHVVGKVQHDEIYRVHQRRREGRDELRRRYRLPADRKLCVMSVPNYGEHNFLPMPEHLELVERHCAAIQDVGASFVLSLHPKSKAETYQAIAARYGMIIASEPLTELLPLADVFLCSNSTTIDWALLCGLPVINMDYCELDYDEMKLPGVLRTTSAEALRTALQCLVDEPAEAERLTAAQRETAEERAVFDGRVGERFVALLNELYDARAEQRRVRA